MNFRRKHNKYRVAPKKRRTVDDIVFASFAEATRYCELKILRACGDVRQFGLQPVFELGDVKYIADFAVQDKSGAWHVEDVKGVSTPMFNLKKKLWKKYGNFPLVILTLHRKRWRREVVSPVG